jgi:hypothetical protein
MPSTRDERRTPSVPITPMSKAELIEHAMPR